MDGRGAAPSVHPAGGTLQRPFARVRKRATDASSRRATLELCPAERLPRGWQLRRGRKTSLVLQPYLARGRSPTAPKRLTGRSQRAANPRDSRRPVGPGSGGVRRPSPSTFALSTVVVLGAVPTGDGVLPFTVFDVLLSLYGNPMETMPAGDRVRQSPASPLPLQQLPKSGRQQFGLPAHEWAALHELLEGVGAGAGEGG